MELGYVQAPHKTFPVVFDSPRNGELQDFPYKRILVSGPGRRPQPGSEGRGTRPESHPRVWSPGGAAPGTASLRDRSDHLTYGRRLVTFACVPNLTRDLVLLKMWFV